MRCNAEDRQELLKSRKWTMEQLESDPNYSEYHEPKVPFVFLWIYQCFLEIYSHSGESITWTEIESYGKLRKIDFRQNEIDLLLKMTSWSNNQISEMRDRE